MSSSNLPAASPAQTQSLLQSVTKPSTCYLKIALITVGVIMIILLVTKCCFNSHPYNGVMITFYYNKNCKNCLLLDPAWKYAIDNIEVKNKNRFIMKKKPGRGGPRIVYERWHKGKKVALFTFDTKTFLANNNRTDQDLFKWIISKWVR